MLVFSLVWVAFSASAGELFSMDPHAVNMTAAWGPRQVSPIAKIQFEKWILPQLFGEQKAELTEFAQRFLRARTARARLEILRHEQARHMYLGTVSMQTLLWACSQLEVIEHERLNKAFRGPLLDTLYRALRFGATWAPLTKSQYQKMWAFVLGGQDVRAEKILQLVLSQRQEPWYSSLKDFELGATLRHVHRLHQTEVLDDEDAEVYEAKRYAKAPWRAVMNLMLSTEDGVVNFAQNGLLQDLQSALRDPGQPLSVQQMSLELIAQMGPQATKNERLIDDYLNSPSPSLRFSAIRALQADTSGWQDHVLNALAYSQRAIATLKQNMDMDLEEEVRGLEIHREIEFRRTVIHHVVLSGYTLQPALLNEVLNELSHITLSNNSLAHDLVDDLLMSERGSEDALITSVVRLMVRETQLLQDRLERRLAEKTPPLLTSALRNLLKVVMKKNFTDPVLLRELSNLVQQPKLRVFAAEDLTGQLKTAFAVYVERNLPPLESPSVCEVIILSDWKKAPPSEAH